MQIRFQVLTSVNYNDCLLQGCDPLKSSSEESTLLLCYSETAKRTVIRAAVCLMFKDVVMLTTSHRFLR